LSSTALQPQTRKAKAAVAASCFVLLALHGVLALDAAWRHNLAVDEGGHLLAGVLTWRTGRLDVYRVNPPLVKALATLPVLAAEPEVSDSLGCMVAPTWVPLHIEFMRANAPRYMDLVFRARCVVVGLSILGGFLVYRWGRDLFGPGPGLLALALWVLCPNVLAWAGFCSVDLGPAVFGLAAVYAFRAYLHRPDWLSATWVGTLLGVAQLTKFSLLVLYPVLLIVWAVAWFKNRRAGGFLGSLAWVAELGVVVTVSILVIGVGYGFKGCGRTLEDFPFQSPTFRRLAGSAWVQGTWLARCPVPLPEDFVMGLDEQKWQADAGSAGYLRGSWRVGGWWYYYLYALGVKLPLGTLCLFALGGALALCRSRYRAALLDELLLWLPAGAICLLISSQTGINGHFRYLLPMLPFLFVATSRVGILLAGPWRLSCAGRRLPRLAGAAVAVAALGWNAAAVARTHPHYLSYFNELAGGPDNGWRHLLESNVDWGQDLFFLKAWLDQHPEAAPLRLAYYGGLDPHLAGLDYQLPRQARQDGRVRPPPGWYAVSVNFVCGAGFMTYGGDGKVVHVPMGAYSYFGDLSPVAKAGYSIFIYHIAADPASRGRQPGGGGG
jgi:hypothetical protein